MNSETEAWGFLQKKSSKGIYQQRYFKTIGNKLEYWKDQSDHDQRKPSTSFDINDIKVILCNDAPMMLDMKLTLLDFST